MYTIADYIRHYEDCQKSLELAKDIVGRKKFKGVSPSPAIKELRESLIRLFSKSELSGICKNCGGDCCITHNFSLTPLEFLCFTIENPNFELPEPDWRFLKRQSENANRLNSPCLFLSVRGCLLKDYRSMICLLFYDCDFSFKPDSLKMKIKEICSRGKERKIFSVQTSRYLVAREDFCQQVFQAAGISKDPFSVLKIKGVLISGIVGYAVCLEALEKIKAGLDK